MAQRLLLVGNESDTHLRKVADKLRKREVDPVVFDADTMAQASYSLTPHGLVVDGTAITDGGRGWLRRAAPFVAQARIEVRQHLRVVTAGRVVATAALEADMWPLDWRVADEAHYSWRRHESPEVETQAVQLAAELRVGFSSQDWLVPISGPPMFIDLNPAGQWMFLPDDVADPITEQIVSFLSGQS